MHSFKLYILLLYQLWMWLATIRETFQLIFSRHRRLVSHRYRRPTIVYVNEDTAGQETLNKYLGILSSSSAYYLSKLYPKPTLQNFLAFLFMSFFLKFFRYYFTSQVLKIPNFFYFLIYYTSYTYSMSPVMSPIFTKHFGFEVNHLLSHARTWNLTLANFSCWRHGTWRLFAVDRDRVYLFLNQRSTFMMFFFESHLPQT